MGFSLLRPSIVSADPPKLQFQLVYLLLNEDVLGVPWMTMTVAQSWYFDLALNEQPVKK